MGFSVAAGGLDDEERRRREQEAIARQSQQAVSQTNDALGRAVDLAEKQKTGDEQLAQQKAQLASTDAFRQQELAQQHDNENQNYQLRMRDQNNAALRTNLEHFDNEAKLRMASSSTADRIAHQDKAWNEYVKTNHLPTFVQGGIAKGIDDDVDLARMAKEHLGIDVDPLEIRGMRYALGRKSDAADTADDVASARADELEARAGKEGRAPAPGAAKAPKGAGGKAKGAAAIVTPQSVIDAADELAKIYEKNGDATGVAGPGAIGPLADEDVIRAEQLGTTLSLGVPRAFSKSNRLNNTEFKESHKAVVGDVHALDTNEHKAARARRLRDDLKAMKAEEDAAGGSLPAQGGLDSKAKRDARIKELMLKALE